jgi:methanol metabolism-related c-type cytochrome
MRFRMTTLSLAGAAMMTVAATICGPLLPGTAAAQSGDADWEKEPYIIRDGKVDYGTYNGFRRYHSSCHVCHGPDAMGSSYAPALKDSMRNMSYSEFLEVVVNGRQAQSSGQDSVMPPFAEAEDVMLYIDHIYAYLKARSDDAVGRGRPDRLDPDDDPVFKEWKASQ